MSQPTERNLNQEFRAELSRCREKSLEELLTYGVTFNAYGKAITVITEYYQVFDQTGTPEDASNLFNEWLFNRSRQFSMYSNVLSYQLQTYHI